MKIFLSYASEERAVAEKIQIRLASDNHDVFFDRTDLPAGGEYDSRIEHAIEEADRFVFLISPESVSAGRYTRTELVFARRKWESPDQHVLPVIWFDQLRSIQFLSI